MKKVLIGLLGILPTAALAAEIDIASLKASREAGFCKKQLVARSSCNDFCIYRDDFNSAESRAFSACHRQCDEDNWEINRWNEWARKCGRPNQDSSSSKPSKKVPAVSHTDRREMEELRALQETSRQEYHSTRQDEFSKSEARDRALCADEECKYHTSKEYDERRRKRDETAAHEEVLRQNTLQDIREHRERRARDAEEAQRIQADILNSASQYFTGLATQQTNNAPPPASPPLTTYPSYVPETGSIGSARSQTLTPRNLGSGSRSGSAGTGRATGDGTRCADAVTITGERHCD